MLYMNEEYIISRVYNNWSGFGSLKQTLAGAKEFDPSIKLDTVRQWMAENTKRKKQLPRQSSFVANGPYYEIPTRPDVY